MTAINLFSEDCFGFEAGLYNGFDGVSRDSHPYQRYTDMDNQKHFIKSIPYG